MVKFHLYLNFTYTLLTVKYRLVLLGLKVQGSSLLLLRLGGTMNKPDPVNSGNSVSNLPVVG